jgi:hypothetical protein
MPKIKCTLPNASDLISGVKFTNGVSDDISEAEAARFLSIPGYSVVEEDAPVVVKTDAGTVKPVKK